MRKKFGKLALAALMCTVLVAGCGDKKGEDVSNNDGTNQGGNENGEQPTGSVQEPGSTDGENGGEEKEPENAGGENDGKNGGSEEEPGDGDREMNEDGEEPGSTDGETDGNGEDAGNVDGESGETGENTEQPDNNDKEEVEDTSGEDVKTVTASDVQNLYVYGWNGSGVDFSKTELQGWNDNDTASPMVDANGNSVYHSADNWGSDAYLVFDFGAGSTVGTVEMTTTNADILADSWAVYGGNQLNNEKGSWDVLMVSSEMHLSGNVIEVPVNGAYQYIMIGGYHADEFMNAWVHSWGYMTEIAFVQGTASEGGAPENAPDDDTEKEEKADGKEPNEGESGKDTQTTAGADVQLYLYGWNGSGVDFSKFDLVGWNDNDTTSPMTDANGNSMYHSPDNWGSDTYLVFDFGAGRAVRTVEMATIYNDILADSWAVYGGNQLSNAEGSWDVIMLSSQMQLSDGVIEVPVNQTYQYIMIGGYNADEFMNAWVHSWDYMTEITFME